MLVARQGPRCAVFSLSRGYVSFSRAMADEAESSSASSRRLDTSTASPAAPTTEASSSTTQPQTLESQKSSATSQSQSPLQQPRKKPTRRPLSRAMAVIKAKKIAEALRGANTDSPFVPNPNPVHPYPFRPDYFSPSLSAASSVPTAASSPTPVSVAPDPITSGPTLSDLVAKRPTYRPSPSDPDYLDLYASVHDSIMQAFVRPQVAKFAKELEIAVTFKESKDSMVRKIMASWGWVVRRPEPKPRPMVERETQVTPAHLFLLQRDANTLHILVHQHKLQLSVVQGEPQADGVPGPLLLKVKGRENDVDHVQNILNVKISSKRTLRWSTTEMHGFRPSRELLDVITSAADAYVDQVGDNEYEATSVDEKKTMHAKNLLMTCAERSITLPAQRELIAVGSTPKTFTPSNSHFSGPGSHTDDPLTSIDRRRFLLSPFHAAVSASVPWDTAADLGGRILFRPHRVEPWRSAPAVAESEHKNEDLSAAAVTVVHNREEVKVGTNEVNEGKRCSLEEILKRQLATCKVSPERIEGADIPSPSLVLKFGHFVYPGTTGSGLDALAPPLEGQWKHDDVARTLGSLNRPVFIPGLTPVLAHFPLPGPLRRFRRISYRLDSDLTSSTSSPSEPPPPSRRMVFTYEHPSITPPVLSGTIGQSWTATLDTLDLDRFLRETKEEENRFDFKALGRLIGATSSSEGGKGEEVERVEGDEGITEVDGNETMPSSNPEKGNKSVVENIGEHLRGVQLSDTVAPPEVVFEHSTFTETDVLLMERPIDMRLTTKMQRLVPASHLPPRISSFFSTLASLPSASISSIRSANSLPTLDSNGEPQVPKNTATVDPNPPQTVQPSFRGELYRLEMDEEIEVAERRAFGSDVVVRTVRSVEQRASGRATVYTELESVSGELDTAFWEELSSASRDVPPDAGAVRNLTQ